MDGDFKIRIDPLARIAVLEMNGTWTQATVDRWKVAFDEMLASAAAKRGLCLLVDLRGTATHSRDVADRLEASRLEALGATNVPVFKRVAIILPTSALATLQTRRMHAREGNARTEERHFGSDEYDAARAWLDEVRSA